ncbi:MAG: hypothetical protein PHI85_03540 [Victivallaceae bacterium]|nr:hypothetical protein [Victivallaceae bacterium]
MLLSDRLASLWSEHRRAVVFWGFMVLLSLNLGSNEIVRLDVRFALMVQEMALRPIGCFPLLNGQPYCDYLSTMPFFSYLASFGGRWLNYFTLDLPTLLLSSYIALKVFDIGEALRRNGGACAVMMLLLCYEYVNLTRTMSLDIAVAASSAAIAGELLAPHGGAGGRPRHWLIVLALLFAFSVRGAMGVIMAGSVLGGILSAKAEWKMLIGWAAGGALIAAACAAALLGWIIHTGGRDLLEWAWDWQVASRFNENKSHIYYFIDAVGSYAPLYPLALAVFVLSWRKIFTGGGDRTAVFLRSFLLWYLLPTLAVSVPGCMHLRYIAPALPGLALAAGYGMAGITDFPGGGELKRVLEIFARLAIPVVCAAVVAAGAVWVGWFGQGAAASGAALAGLAVWWWWRKVKCADGETAWLKTVSGLGVCGALLTVGVLSPLDSLIAGSGDFVRRCEELRTGGIWLLNIGVDHDDLKYVIGVEPEKRGGIHYLLDKPLPDKLAKMYPVDGGTEQLSGLPAGALVLVRRDNCEKVLDSPYGSGWREAASGKLGRREFILLCRGKK